MSSAAVTAPGNRSSYLNCKTSSSKRSKLNPISSSKTSDVQQRKHVKPKIIQENKNKKSQKRFVEEEQSWMSKAENVVKSAYQKLNAGTDAKHEKTLNQTVHQAKEKHTIKIMSINQYEQIAEENAAINRENDSLKNRVSELESEVSKVLLEFEKICSENEKLRKKLDTGSKPLLEPYSRVFQDRDILREAEVGYKRRIAKLEKEVQDQSEKCQKMEEALKIEKSRIQKIKEQNIKAVINKLLAEKKNLETEIENRNAKIRNLEENKCKKCGEEMAQCYKCSKEVTKPKKKPIRTPRVAKIPFVTAEHREITNSYREQFLLRNGQHEFDYMNRLPDSDEYDW